MRKSVTPILLGMTAVVGAADFSRATESRVIRLHAKDTLTALEMNHGDTLRFALKNGQTRVLELLDTSAAIHERVTPGGIVYSFDCQVRIDGQPMTLRRYVCTQEAFHEPYVVNGMRVWIDTVKTVLDLVPIRYPRLGNRQCRPRADARLAVQDASLPICPQETMPWHPGTRDFIDCRDNYNGDDCYLGPYLGKACHVGLDINHPKGDPLFVPIDLDDHFFFNSLRAGDNNNRWRGIRRWKNGDVWAIQSHHLIGLLVPERGRLAAGTKYATTAGVHVGSHQHTHYELKIARRPGHAITLEDFDDESAAAQAKPFVLHLDPWILFRQTFEDRKARNGAIHAEMTPLSPAQTGVPVAFSATPSRPGPGGKTVSYWWTFGDDGGACGCQVTHVFARREIYPVTLVIDNGVQRVGCTRHLTIEGVPVKTPVLALAAEDEPSFRTRPPWVADVYGWPVRQRPRTIVFVARASRPRPRARTITLRNLGDGVLAKPRVHFSEEPGWLRVDVVEDAAGTQLSLRADASDRQPGQYEALLSVDCPGALNSPQVVPVVLNVPAKLPSETVVVDDQDPQFYATPYFWVGHRFCRCPKDRRGYAGFYLTNGGRSMAGEYVRFTPDLRAGRYDVALSEETPFAADVEVGVRVRHRCGKELVRVCPSRSRAIGTFDFDEGTDGFVEILAQESRGLVVADAVVFRRTRTGN